MHQRCRLLGDSQRGRTQGGEQVQQTLDPRRTARAVHVHVPQRIDLTGRESGEVLVDPEQSPLGAVVKGEKLPVRGGRDVDLDDIGTGGESGQRRRAGVLGDAPDGGAAVRHHERPVLGEAPGQEPTGARAPGAPGRRAHRPAPTRSRRRRVLAADLLRSRVPRP